MIKRFLTYLLLITFALNVYAQTTYYFKLTNIHENKSSLKIQGGQFITFVGDICYESDNKGIGVGHGTLTYNPHYSNNNIKKYMGKSYWGNDAVYTFNADKSVLNVITETGMILVYKRATPPNGVYTCSLIREKQPSQGSSNPNSAYIQDPIPVYGGNYGGAQSGGNTSSPSKQWRTVSYQESCPLCHGTGRCSTCDGKRWYMGFGYKLDCPNCTDGTCSKCHGTGSVTKTKQVYE